MIRQTLAVLVVHGTRKFLDRVGGPTITPDERSTTVLGSWYATVWFWKPQVALFVNEATLRPILVPFAPAASVIDRLRAAVERALHDHGLPEQVIEAAGARMAEHRLAPTTNRSVVGIMNEFGHLSHAYRNGADAVDLGELSTWFVADAMRAAVQEPCQPGPRVRGTGRAVRHLSVPRSA